MSLVDSSSFVEPTSRETDELLALATHIHVDADRIVDGRVSDLHSSGGYGGLRSARDYEARSTYIAIYRPTAGEVAEAELYHDHCAEHGYPFAGVDATGYPPAPGPRVHGVYAGMTWTKLRREMIGEGDARQLDLLGATA